MFEFTCLCLLKKLLFQNVVVAKVFDPCCSILVVPFLLPMFTHWNAIARVRRKESDWICDRPILVLNLNAKRSVIIWVGKQKVITSLCLKGRIHMATLNILLLLLSRNGVLSRECRSDPISCPATRFPPRYHLLCCHSHSQTWVWSSFWWVSWFGRGIGRLFEPRRVYRLYQHRGQPGGEAGEPRACLLAAGPPYGGLNHSWNYYLRFCCSPKSSV